MITYKAIIQYFDVICERHQQINSFTYGEIDLFDKDKFTTYPALHLTPTATAIDDQTITYGFDVVVFDRYNVSTNKMKNEASCLSDSLLILQDICKELTDGKYFINEDTMISMDIPVLATPFIDTEPDNCSGWTTSFDIITPNESSACSIPYFNSEQQFSNDVVLPPEAPSTNYVWYSLMNMSSKAGWNSSGQITSLGAFKDTLSGTDTLSMTGSAVTFDRLKNAFHLSDSAIYSDGYLEHGDLGSENATFFIKIKDFSRYGVDSENNTIMSWGDDAEVKLEFVPSGKLQLHLYGNYPILSDFTLTPTNGTDKDTAHRRLEPLTICVQFTSTHIHVFYSDYVGAKISYSSSFDLTDEKFRIGAKGDFEFADFYFQEMFFTTETMSDADIKNTMQWLNYR